MSFLLQRAIEFATKLNSILGTINTWKDDYSDVDISEITQLLGLIEDSKRIAQIMYSKVLRDGKKKTQKEDF